MSFLSNLFGGNSAPQINYTPSGITNPTGFSIAGGNVSQSPTLQSNISGLQSTFGQQANALGGLAATVQPGFSQITKAGLQQIGNTFKSNLSNLKDTLAQRRVLGSSFANSQISEAYANEAEQKANFTAQSYLESLQASYQLIQAQYTAQTQGYTAAINQSNIEAATAAQLTAANNTTAAQIATANAQLQAQAQAGAGSFLGTLLGLGTGTNNSTLGGSLLSGAGSLGSNVADYIAGGGSSTLGPLLAGGLVLP